MGTEPLPNLPDGRTYRVLRKRHHPPKPHPDLIGWKYTCNYCDYRTITRSPESHAKFIEWAEVPQEYQDDVWQMNVPIRCLDCAAGKYQHQTRKRLHEVFPERVKGYKPLSLHTYTLGKAVFVNGEHQADERFYELHAQMKLAFRKFIHSKWWKNRVDGCFYVIEVKKTDMPDGTIKLHPHVHALVSHKFDKTFKQAATDRGLGSYVKIIRLGTRRIDITKSVSYILKYAFKEYGDPLFKGRYYETTGCFRKPKSNSHSAEA